MNNKFNIVFNAPVLNRSGYGEWADDLAAAIIKYPLFNTVIIPTGWGACQMRQVPGPHDDIIKKHIVASKQLSQPHIYISHTLPHLAQPQGSIFNINISAGLEVDRMPDLMMSSIPKNPQTGKSLGYNAGVNHWDLNIVMSKFSKQVYENSNIKPTKPIEVLNWCMNTELFKPSNELNSNIEEVMNSIAEEEAFLFIGQATTSLFFMDRKNIDQLVKLFCETFKGKDKKPALILKTSGCNFSIYDRNQTLEHIKAVKQMVTDNDVSVYLLHGELNNTELNALYNHKKVIAFVTATRGEGAGGSLMQCSLVGKPIIAPNHSGYLDFLDDRAILTPGNLVTVPDQSVSEWIIKDSKWFEIEPFAFKTILSDFYYNDRTRHIINAKSLCEDNQKKFAPIKMEQGLHKIFDKYLKH